MTITTDNAIAKEGFSANYTIRERILPPGHDDQGQWESRLHEKYPLLTVLVLIMVCFCGDDVHMFLKTHPGES